VSKKATYQKLTGEVFGVKTAFHVVEQPIDRTGEIRMTISVQMPALRFEDGVLKSYPNPKNRP